MKGMKRQKKVSIKIKRIEKTKKDKKGSLKERKKKIKIKN